MAAERYLSRRIPDLRVGNNIDEIDKKLIPASIHPWSRRADNETKIVVTRIRGSESSFRFYEV